MTEEYYGVISEEYDPRDWVILPDTKIPRSPMGTDSFIKNGEIVYEQNQVSPVCCTIAGSAVSYSALTGYRFEYGELSEIWAEAIKRGADPKKGWSGNSGVHIVHEYAKDNNLPKVNYFRVDIGSFEQMAVMRLGYNISTGYRGSAGFREDRNDNDIIDNVETPENVTYGHWLSTAYSKGDEFDKIVDSYPKRDNNILSSILRIGRKPEIIQIKIDLGTIR